MRKALRLIERMPFTVTALDAEQAIERAIKEYDVPPARAVPRQRAARGVSLRSDGAEKRRRNVMNWTDPSTIWG